MKTSVCLSLLLLLAACQPDSAAVDTAAPTARKPSYFESDKRQAATPVKTQTPALSVIRSRADFDLLSRVYEQDSEYEIPHVLFLIDREDNNRTDYINTPKYRLHENYLAEILKPMPTRKELFEQYRSPNRRFLFGTISWQNSTQEYVYEFWEGDKITPELLKLAEGRLKDSFFAPLRYKTNSLWQETVVAQSKVSFVTQESLIQNFPYLPLHRGKAVGTLRVITQEDDLYDVGADDIIILKEVPLVLPPVAGIISEKPSTALSHVNVLARGWGIPNIYLKDAEKILAPYIGRRIELVADAKQYRVAQTNRNTAAKTFSDDLSLPQPDTSDYSLRPLANLRREDSRYCGSKAANLGHIRAHIAGSNVPDGFCIPFAYYRAMMDKLGINAATLAQIESQSGGDNRKRRTALLALQKKITDAEIPSEWKRTWAEQWRSQLNSKGVFVRSSSNSEDLPNFSGAGTVHHRAERNRRKRAGGSSETVLGFRLQLQRVRSPPHRRTAARQRENERLRPTKHQCRPLRRTRYRQSLRYRAEKHVLHRRQTRAGHSRGRRKTSGGTSRLQPSQRCRTTTQLLQRNHRTATG